MKIQKKLALIWLLALASSKPAIGVPVPVFDLHQLIQKADVIVVGTVARVHTVGPADADTPVGNVHGTLMLADVTVEAALKGDPGSKTVECRFLLPSAPMGYRSLAEGKYRIVFLKRDSTGYVLADPYNPYLVAVPTPGLHASNELDGVVAVLAAVISAATTDVNDKREAIRALSQAATPEALAVLRSSLDAPDQAVALNAAAGLVANNDLAGVEVAKEALNGSVSALPDDAVLNLRAAIERHLTNVAAIPALRELLTSPSADTETRRVATSALGNMRSPTALGSLGIALNDPDFDVRRRAVIGLALVTGQPNRAPSWDEFRAHQSEYIAYWKDWLAKK